MRNRLSLKTHLVIGGLSLAIVPMLIIAVFAYRQNLQMRGITNREALKLAYSDLDHIALNVYGLVNVEQENLKIQVNASLNAAKNQLEHLGAVKVSNESVAWSAVNQLNGSASAITLPKLLIGGEWVGQNKDPQKPSLYVDDVKKMLGGACTVFQRMNPEGDMLRVLTNVEDKEGKRAIGTFIPARTLDNSPNPVVTTVLAGQRYLGRAFVVNAWYITAYEPLYDSQKNVIGMLFFGIKEENIDSLRQQVVKTKVGTTGYVYVLDSKGRYIISKDGKRDGENIWETRDANGKLIIQDVVQQATKLKPGEIGEVKYAWKNPDDPQPRVKVVRLVYFAPWDWIIGVGTYENEFLAAVQEMDRLSRASTAITLTFAVAVAIIVAVVTFIFALIVSGRLGRISRDLKSNSSEISVAAGMIRETSHQLADGANQQAAGIEQTQDSLKQIAARSSKVSELTEGADNLMKENIEKSGQSLDRIAQMTQAMQRIQADAGEMAKITKTVEEIAFQTNLLALNAAVEAARAGDAGKGFAVVAEEVRRLARRVTEAAQATSALLTANIEKVQSASQGIAEVNSNVEAIVASANSMGERIHSITSATKEVAAHIAQISEAMSELDSVVQKNAASSEEYSGTAEKMAEQVASLDDLVTEVTEIIEPGKAGRS